MELDYRLALEVLKVVLQIDYDCGTNYRNIFKHALYPTLYPCPKLKRKVKKIWRQLWSFSLEI